MSSMWAPLTLTWKFDFLRGFMWWAPHNCNTIFEFYLELPCHLVDFLWLWKNLENFAIIEYFDFFFSFFATVTRKIGFWETISRLLTLKVGRKIMLALWGWISSSHKPQTFPKATYLHHYIENNKKILFCRKFLIIKKSYLDLAKFHNFFVWSSMVIYIDFRH